MANKNKIEILITASAKGVKSVVQKTGAAIKGGFSRGQKEGDKLNATTKSLEKGFLSLKSAVGGIFAGFAIKETIGAMFSAGVQVQRLNRSMEAITGSSRAAAEELAWLRQTADRLGQEFYTVADSYKGFLAASQDTELAGQATRDIFLATMEASTALGMSVDDTQGALRAFTQMVSKGNVQAEELRGQLGERLYGAFNLAAQAMGKSTSELNKMLENGEVLAKDLLPELARLLHEKYGQAAVDASDDAQAAVNRFSTAWKDLKGKVSESGFLDSATRAVKNITESLNDESLQRSLKDFATNLGVVVEMLSKMAKYAGLRSVTQTFNQGVELANKDLIDWHKFVRASFTERQRMVDDALAMQAEQARQAQEVFEFEMPARPTGAKTPASQPQAGADDTSTWLENISADYETARIAAENYYAAIEARSKNNEMSEVDRVREDLFYREAQIREAGMMAIQEGAEKTRAIEASTMAEKDAAAEIKQINEDLLAAKKRMYQQSLDALRRSLDEALALEKKYAEEAKRLKQEIADLEMSLQDKIRALRQRDMTDEEREADLALQAEEKLTASDTALEGGDQAQARQLAQQAGDIAYGLSDTDQAIALLTRAADAEKGVLEEQVSEAEANMEAARAAAAGFAEDMQDIRTGIESEPITVTFDVNSTEVDTILERLERLRKRGIRIGTDGAGTGGDPAASVAAALDAQSLPVHDTGAASVVAAGARMGGSETVNLNLVIGGGTYPVIAEKDIVDALKRALAMEGLKTGGHRPAWEVGK